MSKVTRTTIYPDGTSTTEEIDVKQSPSKKVSKSPKSKKVVKDDKAKASEEGKEAGEVEKEDDELQ